MSHSLSHLKEGLVTAAKVAIVVVIIVIVVVAGYSAYALGVFGRTSTTQSLTSVNLILPFQPVGEFSFFYYGIAHGIYQNYGIDLTVIPGTGSLAIESVAAQKVSFGFVDPALMTVVDSQPGANTTNLKIISIIQEQTIDAYIYNAAKISKPSDLNNKTMAYFIGDTTETLFPIFANLNGVNVSSVHLDAVAPQVFNQLVGTGQADFTAASINQLADVGPVAAEHGITLGAFYFPDYGLNFYGDSLVTSQQLIQSNPGLVQRFVNATLESLVQAALHPSDSIAAIRQTNPQLNATTSLGDWEETVSHCDPNINSTAFQTNPLTFGWVNATKMQFTVSIVAKGYNITSPVSPSILYTNQFVTQPAT